MKNDFEIPINIVSRDFELTDSIKSAVSKNVANLETFFDRIIRCEVAISSPHHHHHRGRIYHIRIVLDVPGRNIVVSRESEKDGSHEDIYVALRDAFKAAGRQLQDHVKKLRREVKNHESNELSKKGAAL